jgi:hypothetical protein
VFISSPTICRINLDWLVSANNPRVSSVDCSLDRNAHLLAIISEVTFVNKPLVVEL